MNDSSAASSGRTAYLASLQGGLERTVELAQFLTGDPVVGGEARCLLSRLIAIQAEIEIIASYNQVLRPNSPVNDHDWPRGVPLWQTSEAR